MLWLTMLIPIVVIHRLMVIIPVLWVIPIVDIPKSIGMINNNYFNMMMNNNILIQVISQKT